MKKENWQSMCVDVMKTAEYDKKFEKGLIAISRKAIRENRPIYDVIQELVKSKNVK